MFNMPLRKKGRSMSESNNRPNMPPRTMTNQTISYAGGVPFPQPETLTHKGLPPTPNQASIQRKELPHETNHHVDGPQLMPAEVSNHTGQFASLEEELADEKLKSAYFEGEMNKLVAELASLHSMDPFRKDDSYIVSMVKTLRYHITTWSRNYPTGKIPKNNLFQQSQQEKQDHWFGAVVADPKMYLREGTEYNLQVLLQGYLWMKLINNIFKRLVWTGGACVHRSGPGDKECKLYKSMMCLNQLVRDRHQSDEIYLPWRAETCRVVADIAHKPCVDAAIRSIVKEVKGELRSLKSSDDDGFWYDKSGSRSKTITLESVIRNAVELDQILSQQRADYFFLDAYGKNFPEAFKPFLMEEENNEQGLGFEGNAGQQGPPIDVEIVKAPALIKYGDSAGKQYIATQHLVLLSAVVDLKRPSRPPVHNGLMSRLPAHNGMMRWDG